MTDSVQQNKEAFLKAIIDLGWIWEEQAASAKQIYNHEKRMFEIDTFSYVVEKFFDRFRAAIATHKRAVEDKESHHVKKGGFRNRNQLIVPDPEKHSDAYSKYKEEEKNQRDIEQSISFMLQVLGNVIKSGYQSKIFSISDVEEFKEKLLSFYIISRPELDTSSIDQTFFDLETATPLYNIHILQGINIKTPGWDGPFDVKERLHYHSYKQDDGYHWKSAKEFFFPDVEESITVEKGIEQIKKIGQNISALNERKEEIFDLLSEEDLEDVLEELLNKLDLFGEKFKDQQNATSYHKWQGYFAVLRGYSYPSGKISFLMDAEKKSSQDLIAFKKFKKMVAEKHDFDVERSKDSNIRIVTNTALSREEEQTLQENINSYFDRDERTEILRSDLNVDTEFISQTDKFKQNATDAKIPVTAIHINTTVFSMDELSDLFDPDVQKDGVAGVKKGRVLASLNLAHQPV